MQSSTMAEPGIVLVSKNGGGIGRLRQIPAAAMASPVSIVIPGASKTRAKRGRTIFSSFSAILQPKRTIFSSTAKEIRRSKTNPGSQGFCPKAIRIPHKLIASPKGTEIPGIVTGAKNGRQINTTIINKPRPCITAIISRIVSGPPAATSHKRCNASERRSFSAGSGDASDMEWAIKHDLPRSALALDPCTQPDFIGKRTQ